LKHTFVPALFITQVPFDTVLISQSREGVTGRLAETVELFSRRNGKEIPFMRMAEEGILYRPSAP